MKPVKFLTDLDLTVLLDNSYRLKNPFYVLLSGQEVIIPADFKTDLASVPRVPVVYLALGGRGHKAAVIHDWLYQTCLFSREDCDGYFYHALRESGIGYFYAMAMYRGVRLGGGAYYDANLNRKNE